MRTRSATKVSCRSVHFTCQPCCRAAMMHFCLVPAVRNNKTMGRFSSHHRTPSRNSSEGSEWFFGVALAVSMTIVFAYLRQKHNPPSDPPPPKKSELLQYNGTFFTLPGAARFLKVADQIRSRRLLSTNNRLLLYSLYKQATRGDAPLTYESRRMHLSFSSAVLDHGKWEAWNRVRGMSQQRAIQAYNSVASEVLSADSGVNQPEVYIHVHWPGSRELSLVPRDRPMSYRLPAII